MSSITLHIELNYPDSEHTRLVFEAFSQWPTNTVRKKTPDARRMKAIKCSMEWIGYELPTIYKLVFEDKSCALEQAPIREGNMVRLHFYCGKWAGIALFDALFNELCAIPVTIVGHLDRDLDDFQDSRTLTID